MTDNQAIPPTPPAANNDEIDLLVLARALWNGRRTLLKTTGIFLLLGILIVLISATEYTASTTIVPQMDNDQSKLSGFSGLASMAGIDLNMMSNASDIPPVIYPQIITSAPFQLELMQTPLNFKDIEQPTTLYTYYTEYDKPSLVGYIFRYTFGLPGIILKAIKGKPGKEDTAATGKAGKPLQLTEAQKEVSKKLNKLVAIEYNDKDGYVILSGSMPEALPAAQLAERTQELLQQYITVFKVQKAKARLEFIEQRHDEVKKQYLQAQSELATFRDRNRNVATATAQTELERLNNNYDLIYGVYSELAKQLEQARIQVKEDTPVFTIIKPVSVPLEKSRPKSLIMLIVALFLGGIAGSAIVFGKVLLQPFRQRWDLDGSV